MLLGWLAGASRPWRPLVGSVLCGNMARSVTGAGLIVKVVLLSEWHYCLAETVLAGCCGLARPAAGVGSSAGLAEWSPLAVSSARLVLGSACKVD